jgi:SAM-dependent methyltransferase
VYYSTLIRLLECERCGLVWADAHINPDTIRQHFEVTYKDDEYFREERRLIFEHMALVIDDLAGVGARVLDIGGARGDLMTHVVDRRPDLDVTVNDLSETATAWAAEHFGFSTLTGNARALADHGGRYDLVVLSDVLYYEPDIALLWQALSRLVGPEGAILIRIPNKTLAMRLGQTWLRLRHGRREQEMQSQMPFFNPEHIYVFTQPYLRRRLADMGFRHIDFLPSPPRQRGRPPAWLGGYVKSASLVNRISGHRLVITPSQLVVGLNRAWEAGRDEDLVSG